MPLRRALVAALTAAALAMPAPGGAVEVTVEHGVMRSFDGTPIVYTLFVPPNASRANAVPVVFYTHGWSGERERKPVGRVKVLLDAGYAVLTWDARGFGESGGEVNIDAQQFEVRDVRGLIDLVAARPEIQLDGPADPRMGWTGGSYAGGIQLMTAAADRRVDAIAPEIAWNDLPQSIKPGGVLKLGWGTALYGAGVADQPEGARSSAGPQTGVYDEHIHRGYAEAISTNDWSAETFAWFDARSPKHYIDGATVDGVGRLPGVRAPTLLIQGTSDTLFPLNEAIRNEAQIRRNGVDTKMIFFCGGHTLNAGTSCRGSGSGAVITRALLAWLDRYVNRRDEVDTGPWLEYQLQDGTFHSASRLPAADLKASGSGRIANTVAPTSGAGFAATSAPEAVRIPLQAPAGTIVLGVPRARVQVSGTGHEAYLFFKLVDESGDRRVVVDDQAMARRVIGLSADPKTIEVDLAGVAWKVQEGHRLLLEVSATSNDHAASRTPFLADLDVELTLPTIGAALSSATGGPESSRASREKRRATNERGRSPSSQETTEVLGSRVERDGLRGLLARSGVAWRAGLALALIAAAGAGAVALSRGRARR